MPLVEHLGESATREAWNSLRGIPPNRHKHKGKYKKDTIQNQEKLLELFVNFAHYNTLLLKESNFHKQFRPGRPETTVDIPSEKELTELLLRAGLIEESDINGKNVFKPWEAFASKADYRSLIGTGEYVKRHGAKAYPRSELAALTGCSLSTARKDADRTDTKVESQDVLRKPFKEEYRKNLPDDRDALKRDQKSRVLPGGIHFQTDNGKKFEYTKNGYDACIATGTKLVLECRYQASKYYPSEKVEIIY
jgi:hypothetical protein